MKTSLVLAIIASLSASFTSISAHADDSIFYQNTAQSILDTLQTKANHLNADESAALTLLNVRPDKPSSTDEQSAAERLLAISFKALFSQPDNVVGPIKTEGTLFGGPRDLYTFCPEGADVSRHLSQDVSIVTNQIENIFSWSYCTTPDLTTVQKAVRVQDLWVSNVKHPTLTLLIVADEQIGENTNLDIDLNQLTSGQISEAQILKAISPKK